MYCAPDLEIPNFEGVSSFRNEKTHRKTMRTTSKKCRREEKHTIHDRLTDLYLEYAEKKSVEEGPFIKCNFLEELVSREKLGYVSLAMYPNKEYIFSVKEEYDDSLTSGTALKEDGMKCFSDSIDLEEIPAYLFQLVKPDCRLMYDHHMILLITKFATVVENSRPIFSMFLLLKPTDSICRELSKGEVLKKVLEEREKELTEAIMNGTYVFAATEEEQRYCDLPDLPITLDEEEIEKIYKTILYELAGPLYLDLRSDKASQLVFLLEFYGSPFASNTIKRFFIRKVEKMPPFTFYQTIPTLPESEMLPFFEHTNKIKIFIDPIRNYENRLNTFLRKREIKTEDSDDSDSSSSFDCVTTINESDCESESRINFASVLWTSGASKPHYILVERFKFITTMESGEKKTNGFDVYFRKGQFRVSLKVEGYVYPSVMYTDLAEPVGDRRKLDKYIFLHAQHESEKFMLSMTVYHASMPEDKFKPIFSCGFLEAMEKSNSVNVPFKTSEEQMDITAVGEKSSHTSAITEGISQMQLGSNEEHLSMTENPEGRDETQMQIDNQVIKESSPEKNPTEVSEIQPRRHRKERLLYAQSGASEH